MRTRDPTTLLVMYNIDIHINMSRASDFDTTYEIMFLNSFIGGGFRFVSKGSFFEENVVELH